MGGVLLRDTVEHLPDLTGAQGSGERTTEIVTVSSHQGYTLSTRISLISSPHHLVKVAFPRFLLVNFYFYFPTFHTIVFREGSPCTAHIRGALLSTSFSGGCAKISFQMS